MSHPAATIANVLNDSIAAIVALGTIVHRTQSKKRMAVTTIHGAAYWTSPEDLAASGFLPSNSTIYAGYMSPGIRQ